MNSEGHRLAALADLPVGRTRRAWAILAHCFTCSKNLKPAHHIARALSAEGIAVLRFDFTGLGQSEGDFADTSFSSNIDDLVAAAEHLQANFEAPQILVGHSLGGAAVLQARARIPSVKAVAIIGAPAEPSHVERLLAGKRNEIESRGEAEVELAGRTFRIRRQFLKELEVEGAEATIRSLDAASSFTHPPTRPSVSTTPAASSSTPGIPRASSRSTPPTTCFRTRPTHATPGLSA